MLYGNESEPEFIDPSEGIKLAGFQTVGGQMIAPDPKSESWEWNPQWRYIKRLNLDGEVFGCFPVTVAVMLTFEAPLSASNYMEWS